MLQQMATLEDVLNTLEVAEHYTGPDLNAEIPETIQVKALYFKVHLRSKEGAAFKEWLTDFVKRNDLGYSLNPKSTDIGGWSNSLLSFFDDQCGKRFGAEYPVPGKIKSTGHEYQHYSIFDVITCPITVETKFLFSDQINVARPGSNSGLRLMDCSIFKYDNPYIYSGVIIVDESRALREARRKTYKCNYSGALVSFRDAQAAGFINKSAWLGDYYAAEAWAGVFEPLVRDESNEAFRPLNMPTTAEKIKYRVDVQRAYQKRLAELKDSAGKQDCEKLIKAQNKNLALVNFLIAAGVYSSSILYRGDFLTPGTAGVFWQTAMSDEEKAAWIDYLKEFPGFEDVRDLIRLGNNGKAGI